MTTDNEHVTFDERQATVGDSITMYGGHHVDDSALDELTTVLHDVRPDLIAYESSPVAFARRQLETQTTDAHHVLSYTLRHDIKLALTDMDWAPIYEDYPQPRISAILDEAEKTVDIQDDDPTLLEEMRAINRRVNELDSEFYTKFITQRDLIIARHLAWLATQYENILAVTGIAHLESVAGITADLLYGDDAGLTPQEPPVYDADDLLDLTASKDAIMEAAQYDWPTVRARLTRQFDTYRSRYQQHAAELHGEGTGDA